jgi:hypothetical protein
MQYQHFKQINKTTRNSEAVNIIFLRGYAIKQQKSYFSLFTGKSYLKYRTKHIEFDELLVLSFYQYSNFCQISFYAYITLRIGKK